MCIDKKPLQVIQACDLQAGGITTLILSICEQLDRRKVNFDYLVYRDQEEFGDSRVKALGGRKLIADNTGAPNKMMKFLWKFFRTWKVLKKEGADIFHMNVSTPYDCLMGLAAKLAGMKIVILHSHNSHLKKSGLGHQVFQGICRSLLPVCGDYYFACSDLAGKFLYGKALQKKVIYVKNGIHTEEFRFQDEVRKKMRKEYSLRDELIIGTVGRFCRQKNQKFLLEIFAEILSVCPSTRLLLIGQGELEEELMAQAEDLGILQSLIHIPSTDKVKEFLCMMDVFLLPSLFEGLPVVGVEAQASGLPCLFSNRITKEVRLTDRAYFLALEHSAEEWARCTISAAKKAREHRSGYADQVRAAGYDIKDIAEWLQEFYLSL